MASSELFRSLSPLFWVLRVTGGTPFYHSESFTGMLSFQWCHPQTFWFAFVTLVHLSFISAQVFGGLFSLGDDSIKIDKTGAHIVISPTVHLTNSISQARFLFDTFLLSKFIHFNLTSFQIFFERMDSVDCAVPVISVVTHRTRKMIVFGISMNLFWHAAFLIYGINGIFRDHGKDSAWMLTARIIDSIMHIVGQLHSNMLIIFFASLCYIIGLRFAAVKDVLLQTVVIDEGIFRHLWNDTNFDSQNGSPSVRPSNTQPSMQNRVLPDSESLPDVDQPITTLESLRLRPLASRLVFLKRVYLTLGEAVFVHFNQIFGLSLLFYLISKLISVSIGCHNFIHQIMRNLNIDFFWYLTNIPDVTVMFVIFQSADYVRNQVKRFFSSVARISTRDITNVERSEIQTLILQLRGESIELSVCGLFKLGKQLLPAVAGTIATYILVLFQFNASEDVINADVKGSVI